MGARRQIWLVIGMIIFVVGIMAGGRYLTHKRANEQAAVTVPKLSPEASMGKTVLIANCAGCHGETGAGTDNLIHPIYSPPHHSDFSFVRAVTLGVPQLHWLFGAMPAQPQVDRKQIDSTTVYVRELQKGQRDPLRGDG